MKIIENPNKHYTVLELIGEIDAVSAIDLDDGIKNTLEKGVSNLLIDCKKLDYISSAGLGVFMSHIKNLKAANKQLILFELNENVFSTFEILGLHHILRIVKSKEDAIAYCK